MSTQGFLLAAAVLLTVLVGAMIPAIYQLYQTLKRARALLDTAGPRLENTLLHMNEAVERLDSIGSTLENRAHVAAHPGGRGTDWLRRAAIFGSAFAPAAMAGVRAFWKGNGPAR